MFKLILQLLYNIIRLKELVYIYSILQKFQSFSRDNKIINQNLAMQNRSQGRSSGSKSRRGRPKKQKDMEQEQIHEKEAIIGPEKNWVNAETWRFIQSLSFDGYVLAGNSVTNMVQKVPLQGDLDFWAINFNKFKKALKQIGEHYEHFHIYPSMVEMYNTQGNLPRINLILTDLTPMETIQRFDFDYCRCYWTLKNPVVFGTGAEQCIKTKIIRNVNRRISAMRKRILKAIMYGYIFETRFWLNFSFLLVNNNFQSGGNWSNRMPYPVRIEDLNLRKFRLKQVNLKVTDISKVKQTLVQLRTEFEKITKKKNIKLPVLLKIQKHNFHLVQQYAKQIIELNPLSDAHYMRIKIGTNFVYRDPSLNDEDSQGSSQQSQKSMDEETPSDKKQNSNTKTIIFDQNEERTIYLNEDQTAFLEISYLPSNLSKQVVNAFQKMWDLHPKQKHKIIMFEKQVEVSRYSKSYLNTPVDLSHTTKRSYMYSGFDTTKNTQELPAQFMPIYEYVKKIDERYNQVIVNWYEDENDYIAPHSDCQIGMIQDAKVCLISLYPDFEQQRYRFLQIIPKEGINSISGKFMLRLDNASMITMCGKTQQLFKHGVRKESTEKMPRICISFRQMSTNVKNGHKKC